MIVFKLTKADKILYVEQTPLSYFASLEYGWQYTNVSIADDTTLNTLEEIN